MNAHIKDPNAHTLKPDFHIDRNMRYYKDKRIIANQSYVTDEKAMNSLDANKEIELGWNNAFSLNQIPLGHNPLANSHPLGIKNDNSLSKGK